MYIHIRIYIPPPPSYNHHLHIHIQLPPPQTTTHYLPSAISATCMRAHHWPYKPSPHTSCTDSRCVGHICMVCGGGGSSSCMLLLHPIPTSADVGPDLWTLCPDLCTLCPDLCTLHPDLWTLCLWCFPSFNWCKHFTCTGGGCHQLQLALVVLFHPAIGANTALASG